MSKRGWILAAAMVLLLAGPLPSNEAAAETVFPRVIGVDEAESPQEVALSLQILFLLTVLFLAPAILIMTTSFTRIVVVLSFVRSALATTRCRPTRC